MPDLTTLLSRFLTDLYAGTWSVSGSLTATGDGIGTTATDAVVLQNTTPATVGVPVQQGPDLRIRSNVWNTTTPATNTNDWFLRSVPVSGATPSGLLKFGSSLNGGATTFPMTLSSAGALTTLSHVTAGGNLISSNGVMSLGVTVLGAPASAQLLLRNAATTIGVGLKFDVDTIFGLRDRAMTGGATLELLEQTAPVGATNCARIYAEDSAGKTKLMVIMPTGAAIQLAIEP